MNPLSRYQLPVTGTNVFGAAGSTTITLVAAPGSSKSIRVFGVDVILDQASTGRMRAAARIGTQIIGYLGLAANHPTDHVYFGEGGIVVGANQSFNVVVNSAAAGTIYVSGRYLIEG